MLLFIYSLQDWLQLTNKWDLERRETVYHQTILNSVQNMESTQPLALLQVYLFLMLILFYANCEMLINEKIE